MKTMLGCFFVAFGILGTAAAIVMILIDPKAKSIPELVGTFLPGPIFFVTGMKILESKRKKPEFAELQAKPDKVGVEEDLDLLSNDFDDSRAEAFKMLFSAEAIAILRRAVHRSDAARTYEAMSGGFCWSDEMLDEVVKACRRHDSWAFRYILAYRASVIRGEPDARLQAVWQLVARECPNWPGLRPERSSPSLAREMERGCKQFMGNELYGMLHDII